MSEYAHINHVSSYFMGVLTGIVIRWTDIIPIVGGFLLGLSIKQIPDFLNINIAGGIKQMAQDLLSKQFEQNSSQKIPIIKKKDSTF